MCAAVEVADEVRIALASGRPVVALESTIIAHGFPHPANLEVARALEAAVRDQGACPATIAVVAGTARVGLDAAALSRLAAPDAPVAKCGAGDLAAYLAAGAWAATTVSATALLAARAGIRVFATGGIGGVHRGDAGDVSNDLVALSRAPVAVVSSGAKAILDLPRTLETLETLGVLVVGYRADEFPAFYTRGSGLSLEHRAESAAAVAEMMRARFDLLEQGAILVANPIPAQAALPDDVVAEAIARALAEAAAAGVRGKRLTPHLLAAIDDATGGAAVAANRALAVENARVAAAIARAYAEEA